VLDDDAVAEALACSTTGELLVFEVRNGGDPLGARVELDNVAIDRVATETGALSILSQRPDTDWTSARFTVDVWRVRGSSTATCSP